MSISRGRKKLTLKNSLFAVAAGLVLLVSLVVILWFAVPRDGVQAPLKYVSTIAGTRGEIGEPFGIAINGADTYISDGQNGKIWKLTGSDLTVFAEGLDTPSAIAFDKAGNLIVADSGSHTIKSIDAKGNISTLAGVLNKSGFSDGDAASALFNAPIGVSVATDGRVFVADTYNDRIRVIENGKVSTIAGAVKGFADGASSSARFDTPSGIMVWNDRILVADTGNGRIRVVEPDGRVWTLAGISQSDVVDGSLSSASFFQPVGIAADKFGSIFVSDGNAIRMIGGTIPVVATISADDRGLKDGFKTKSRFNRPVGLAFDTNGNLIIADSENRLVRKLSPVSTGHEITADEINALRDKPEQFRVAAPARWPYDPPTAKRDIAGTLGEVRGEVNAAKDPVWFHNGLDIAGSYGETARFLRDEKVLRPIAAENFGTLRELIRMPTLGYIHIRLGRGEGSVFGDERFIFEKDNFGKLVGVRVPRGAKFKAGQPIGTLNSMNHVHLIAGRSGSEMNALDALILPGVSDSRPPVIEKVSIYDQNWNPLETSTPNSRIKLTGNTRIVVKAYDQVDGNSERRRLGVYKLGYQLLDASGKALGETKWTIKFDRMPPNAAVRFVYADKSHSGATGETIFNYIVTNFVEGDEFKEGFLDKASFGTGNFILRVSAADYFGNVSSSDISVQAE